MARCLQSEAVVKEQCLRLGQLQAMQLWFAYYYSWRPAPSQSFNHSLRELSLPQLIMSSEQCLTLKVSLVLLFRWLSRADQFYPISPAISANEATVKCQYLAGLYPTPRSSDEQVRWLTKQKEEHAVLPTLIKPLSNVWICPSLSQDSGKTFLPTTIISSFIATPTNISYIHLCILLSKKLGNTKRPTEKQSAEQNVMKFVYLPISERSVKLDGETWSCHFTLRKLKFLNLKFIGSHSSYQAVTRNDVC